ncbi:hypothetical protein QJS10_CPB11g01181 [Acorus calamus]|uniref:Uncharacterized protein n=1 Tax=Acorus calamus TaxID=4465 RepID=A0AAV9DU37_ACOCL|nr:hypothetical protein QJS10_CPB11g01181 [Acorus calamus]
MPMTSLREALMKTPPVEGVIGVVTGLAAMRNGEALTPQIKWLSIAGPIKTVKLRKTWLVESCYAFA